MNKILMLLLVSSFTFAAEDSLTEKRPLWIYGGVAPGYLNLNSNLESEKDGYLFNAKILGSYYFRNVILDLGLGWFNSEIKSYDDKTRILTRAIYLDFSPRYRINRRWHVGPVLNTFFGTDVSFSERIEYNEHTKVSNFAGIRTDYEFPNGKRRFRVGAQLMTDLDLKNKQIYIAQIDVQFGFPTKYSTEHVATDAPKIAIIDQKTVTVTLETTKDLYFDFDKDTLSEKAKDYIEHLSYYLNANPKDWDALSIEGHTDVRGKASYNLDLSKRRANSVKNEFVSNNVPGVRITAEGYGASKPILNATTEEEHQKNRRVEMRFTGVSDPKEFVSGIKEATTHEERSN